VISDSHRIGSSWYTGRKTSGMGQSAISQAVARGATVAARHDFRFKV